MQAPEGMRASIKAPYGIQVAVQMIALHLELHTKCKSSSNFPPIPVSQFTGCQIHGDMTERFKDIQLTI